MPNFEELTKKAKAIGMTPAEKGELRVRLVERITGRAVPAPRSWLGAFLKPALAALLIFTTVGTGVSFASENSLPGDLLYPVKINVNEKVRTLTAVSEESKIDLEEKLAERRIDEADKLAARAKLADAVKAKLAEVARKHLEKAEQRLAEIEKRYEDRQAEAAPAMMMLQEKSADTAAPSLRRQKAAGEIQERGSDEKRKPEIRERVNLKKERLEKLRGRLKNL